MLIKIVNTWLVYKNGSTMVAIIVTKKLILNFIKINPTIIGSDKAMRESIFIVLSLKIALFLKGEPYV